MCNHWLQSSRRRDFTRLTGAASVRHHPESALAGDILDLAEAHAFHLLQLPLPAGKAAQRHDAARVSPCGGCSARKPAAPSARGLTLTLELALLHVGDPDRGAAPIVRVATEPT